MAEGKHIEDGLWVTGDDGSWVLPAMLRRNGPQYTQYFVPLRAVTTNGRGTLVFDANDLRIALGNLEEQINSRRGYKNAHHRQVRRKKRW